MKSSAPIPFRILWHHRRRTVRLQRGFRPIARWVAVLLAVLMAAAPALADGLYLEGVRLGSSSVLAGDAPAAVDRDGGYGMMLDFRFGGPDPDAQSADSPRCNMNSEERTFLIILVTVGAALGLLVAAQSSDFSD